MGKKNKGPTLRSSDMFSTLLVVCSMDGANICHFPEGALFPFLSWIDYLPVFSVCVCRKSPR